MTDRPMELLLADSSRAQLERASKHPVAGAPGCSVESPFSCLAVRRGNPVTFAIARRSMSARACAVAVADRSRRFACRSRSWVDRSACCTRLGRSAAMLDTPVRHDTEQTAAIDMRMLAQS